MTAALEALVTNTPLSVHDANLGIVQRHSQALLTMLLYADKQWELEEGAGRATDWQAAEQSFAISRAKPDRKWAQ